jgi:uncharacterized protein (UPF0332 family)
MTSEQEDLVAQARESVGAAKALRSQGFVGYAAARAYYAMFYLAKAMLLSKGLTFSKHSSVHAAFGKEFSKTGLVPLDYHRYLMRGMEVRHAGDYAAKGSVTAAEADIQISRAEQFLKMAENFLAKGTP